ncbi:MAG: hypothetical protein FWD60_00350 [Candidatus Azobacteroides sp.]|nr:hypothetical protein [Candidatus Azobacteroides sp.]
MLQKIADLLNKIGEKKPSLKVEKQRNEVKKEEKSQENILPKLHQGDAISLKKQILDFICNSLQGYKYNRSLQMPAITLFVDGSGYDDVILPIATSPDFEKELRLKLTNKGIYATANDNCKWDFRQEKPQNEEAKEIAQGIFLLIHKKAEKQEETQIVIPKKARITILRGSMEAKSYILDAEEQTKWNIGRGKEPVRDERKHLNYIAIKENDYNPKTDEVNHKVSGKHAYIVFMPNEGFKLKTYTKQDDYGHKKPTSTQIQREDLQDSRTFVDEKQEFLLQNEDQIVLANSVILLFEYFTEEMKGVIQTEHTENKEFINHWDEENDLGI